MPNQIIFFSEPTTVEIGPNDLFYSTNRSGGHEITAVRTAEDFETSITNGRAALDAYYARKKVA